MLDARLRRYAIVQMVHGLSLLVVISGVAGAAGLVVFLVSSIPLVFAWGAFQAHLAVNGQLDEIQRSRWRIALWLLPWSMSLYWYRYVRPVAAYE